MEAATYPVMISYHVDDEGATGPYRESVLSRKKFSAR
jgi:hypothetical protein